MSDQNRTINELIELMKVIVANHNDSAMTPEAKRVPWDTVQERFVDLGMTSLETIQTLRYEDLTTTGIPSGIARALTETVRRYLGGQLSSSSGVTPVTAQRLSTEDLIKRLNPHDGTVVIPRELRRRLRESGAQSTRFVVMTGEGEIHVEATAAVFAELRQGDAPRDTYLVNGVELDVVELGEVGNQLADAHPLFPGEHLRGDGSDAQGIRWGELPIEVRQFLFLGTTRKLDSFANLSREDVVDIYQEASVPNALSILRLRYPKTWQVFREQRQVGGLPVMKMIRRRKSRSGNRSQGSGSVANVARTY